MNRPLYQQQDPELRRLKEAFVSNLQGTTRWEVFCVLSSLPLCLLTGAHWLVLLVSVGCAVQGFGSGLQGTTGWEVFCVLSS
jgi:hypothetical protein